MTIMKKIKEWFNKHKNKLFMGLLLTFMVLFIWQRYLISQDGKIEKISYNTFLEYVNDGKVDTIYYNKYNEWMTFTLFNEDTKDMTIEERTNYEGYTNEDKKMTLYPGEDEFRKELLTKDIILKIVSENTSFEQVLEKILTIAFLVSSFSENLIPVVQNAVTYMRARISNRITIDDSCLDEVNRTVMLNAPLLQWVVENLLKNAVDAISGEGAITIQLHENEHDVMIDVSDTGKGIDNKTQRRIFEPGFTSKERGWGLGLPLAKRIIEQYHGGKLVLKSSQVGVGTTFRIILKKPENS